MSYLDALLAGLVGKILNNGTVVAPDTTTPTVDLNFVGSTITVTPGNPDVVVVTANHGTGWHTLLDVDFTALTNQALHTDGVVTLSDGSHWTKSGSSKDGTTNPWAIINGTGLRTSAVMAGTDGFDSTVLTAPTLWPNLLLGTLSGVSRLPVRISAIYGVVQGHSGGGFGTGAHGIGLEARNASSRIILSASEIGVASATITAAKFETSSLASINDSYAPSPAHNCMMLECPSGLLLGQVLHYTAHAATNVFPATPWLTRGVTPNPTVALNQIQGGGTTYLAVWTTDNWHPSIIASCNNDSDEYAILTRFKVEAYF
jgi:hypothetical protein